MFAPRYPTLLGQKDEGESKYSNVLELVIVIFL